MHKLSSLLAIVLCCASLGAAHADLPRPRPTVDQAAIRKVTFKLADLDPSCQIVPTQWTEEFNHRDWYQDGEHGQNEHREQWTCTAKKTDDPHSALFSETNVYGTPESSRKGFTKEVAEARQTVTGAQDWSSQVHLGQQSVVGWAKGPQTLYAVVQVGTHVVQLATVGIPITGPAQVERMVRLWMKRSFVTP
jgi:hypothetical protein